MLKLDGNNLKEALKAITPQLDAAGAEEATQNAKQIVLAIVNTYDSKVKAGEVGSSGTGPVGDLTNEGFCTGLVYGRIQSGKTRAMITSAALAFDNKFRIVVVITSNNNRLVEQTRQDFQVGLPGNIRVLSKTNMKDETDQASQILASDNGGIVLVCSKGASRLTQVIDFLGTTGGAKYPAIIFDDEGDQATLDTNVLKRSTREPLIKPSKTHSLIHDPEINSLREALPRHIFVSVTGTPSGIVLQNVDNRSRPYFIELLKPGKDYVGGETFFSDPTPHNKLITLIDENERLNLFSDNSNDLPDGLKQAVRFFLFAATAAGKDGWPADGKGYKFLCHPSVKNEDQDKVSKLMRHYLNDLSGAFNNPEHHLYNDLKSSYQSLKNQTPGIPKFDTLMSIIANNFASREVLLLNKNTTNEDLSYSKSFNFLVGGNTLGRGLAIKKLLVTYYIREAKRTQMDTMYQHARMFGYRKETLPYTRVFLPPQLYERFHQIFISDESLREFIEKNKGSLDSFPVRIARDIRATRSCILDARKVDILFPGRQIFPNYPYFGTTASEDLITEPIARVARLFPEYEVKGRKGKKISINEAKKLLSMVRTNGSNVWDDKKIPMILSYLGQQFKSGVLLKYRESERATGDDHGLLATGVLAGSDVDTDTKGNKPVLWIVKTSYQSTHKPPRWNGKHFIYPTLVIPNKASLVVFNKS